MGRSAYSLLFAAALAGPAFGQAVIEVGDQDSHGGVLGDDRINLDEAIQLCNGDLLYSQLSPSEQSNIKGGIPGPGVADVVAFSFCCFPGTVTLSADLPPFHDGLDSVDGSLNGYKLGQIKISGGGSFGGFTISASDTTIRRIHFLNSDGAAVVVKAPDSAVVENVLIINSRFVGGDHGVEVVGADGGGGTAGTSSKPVVIEDVEFRNALDTAVRVLGGSTDGNSLVVEMLDCLITNPAEFGVSMVGGELDGPDTGDGNSLSATLKDSAIQDSILGKAAQVLGAGAGANASTSNTVSFHVDNSIFRAMRPGGIAASTGPGAFHDVTVSTFDSDILNNAGGDGISLLADGSGSGSSIHADLLATNIRSNNGAGLRMSTVGGIGTAQSVSAKLISVLFDGNTQGIVVADPAGGHNFDLELFDSFIHGSSQAGMTVDAPSASSSYNLFVQGAAFRGNFGGGVVVASGASSTLALDLGGGPLSSDGGNSFEGNSGCGIDNQSTMLVNAQRNSWDDASGPSDCNAGDSDGITDPSGSGDGCGEYTTWSPFSTFDKNPQLEITGSLVDGDTITIEVTEGVSGSNFFLFAGVFLTNPPVLSALGNHWYISPPVFMVLTWTVDVPISFPPPAGLPDGLVVYLSAAVDQGNGQLTNLQTLRK